MGLGAKFGREMTEQGQNVNFNYCFLAWLLLSFSSAKSPCFYLSLPARRPPSPEPPASRPRYPKAAALSRSIRLSSDTLQFSSPAPPAGPAWLEFPGHVPGNHGSRGGGAGLWK